MRVVVPFDGRDPKTRLAPVLDTAERRNFARVMLADIASTIESVGFEPTILATTDIDCEWPIVVDERSLDAAVNDQLAAADGPIAVVMADLALVTPDALDRLFEADGNVVLAPGRGGGTNAIVARHPDFRVDYHEASITDHRSIAEEIGADTVEVDSFRLANDVDEPDDLAEVLLHGEGRGAAWLRERGFELTVDEGRVSVQR
ncbi:2-phospho-L-lactate guanylyltransferase [Halorhabdus sp. BNX81]|uniref:2-phospho-L-lactate guanylyltransferase n=1 Tax=Halorhabdus sp. BNX81 TaxID=2980181 RepID=UPI0023DD0F61|nr:2-phospho-L-lactate guanylyltransferase [Halorhabdus sp. BNX81]WEL20386.1 2-phospho-L-lactate/phosphoenolpyruvate guanylyltransferase [Halorhabdus sp. BNX81]